jgi:hypothetical protein
MRRIFDNILSIEPQKILVLMCACFVCVVALTFDDYGVNPDEGLHIANGKHVFDWYASGFTDRDIFTWSNVWAYGGAFDVVCHLVTLISPLSVYETRHLLTALIGLLGILGAFALGRMVGSEWTGLLAAGLLLLTPRYYGHAFFNQKDIPFAVGHVWSVALILRCWFSFPKIPPRLIALSGLVIGLTLGLRVGGIS